MPVLYRKYRPQRLSELFGQEVIVKTLLAQLESGKISHGYLFSGPRGTGKTSTARIFARAINCQKYGSGKKDTKGKDIKFGEPCNKCDVCLATLSGSSLDLIEIDAASNRGIDEIRDLREKVKFSPVSARYKVYIIDEAHMLTNEAFNALLKTLEEPPGHAIFILCTTEFSKLPATIVSRLVRFNFTRANESEVLKVVENVAKSEGIKLEKEASLAIAKAADGSFRDAISVLDQVASGGDISALDVKNLTKTIGWNFLFEFSTYLAGRNLKEAVGAIEELAKNGADISLFAKQLVLFLEKLLFIKIGAQELIGSDFDAKQVAEINNLAGKFEYSELQNLMRLFLVAEGEIKIYPLAQIPLVLAVCKYCPVEKDNIETKSTRREEDQESDGKIEKKSAVPNVKEEPEKQIIKKANAGKGKITFAEIEKKWGQYLDKVKNINAHVVALLRATRPMEFDGDILTLEVFYRFHKEKLEEPKIIRMLDGEIDEVMGAPIRLKFILAKREAAPTKAVKASDVVEISDKNLGDLEKIAHEIFSE